jgi:predicted RNA-binding protein YlqC (UPF0109 family)
MNDESRKLAVLIVERLLPSLFRSLCRHPNDLVFNATHYSASSIIRVRPHDDDFPLLMGSGARTFKSLKTILRAISDRHGHKLELEHILGGRPKDAVKTQWPVIEPNPMFDPAPLRCLLVQTVQAFSKDASVDMTKDSSSYRIQIEVPNAEGPNELEMESALTTVWNAMAKLRGGDMRIIYRAGLEGAVPLPPEAVIELQPESADGRYAKAS